MFTHERTLKFLIDNTFLKTVEIEYDILYTQVKEIRFLSFKSNDPDLRPSIFSKCGFAYGSPFIYVTLSQKN